MRSIADISTQTWASMPASTTWRAPVASSRARNESIPQQEKVTFGRGSTPGPSVSSSSWSVWPSPFGYCSVRRIGKRNRRAEVARILMFRMTSSRWSAYIAWKRRSWTSHTTKAVRSGVSVMRWGSWSWLIATSRDAGRRRRYRLTFPDICNRSRPLRLGREGRVKGISLERAGRSPTSHQRLRSSPRYWMASETCSAVMSAAPARSATVRATLRMRSWARAERPSRVTASPRSCAPASGSAHQRRAWRPVIRALTRTSVPAKRSFCRARAAATRARMAAEASPAVVEASGAGGAAGGARNHHVPFLQRLAQRFEDALGELGQLVQEEDAMMGEAHLARMRDAASADEPGFGSAVMRRAERPLADKAAIAGQEAADAPHHRDLDRLLERERRQDAGQPSRQHGLARAGWPDHDDVVATGRGDLEGTLGRGVPSHVGEVHAVRRAAREPSDRVDAGGFDGALAVQVFDSVVDRPHRDHLHGLHRGGLRGIVGGHDQRCVLPAAAVERHGEDAAHRPHTAVQ